MSDLTFLSNIDKSSHKKHLMIPTNVIFLGSSIGGTRPKALIAQDSKKYVAKFSVSSDFYSGVKKT